MKSFFYRIVLLATGLLFFVSCPVSVTIAELPEDFICETSFVSVGDTGMGNADQAAVADAMHERLLATGASFVVLLGDNFYPDGVTSVSDGQWQTKFEDMYGDWGVPVYAVNGNHDYGGSAGAIDAAGQFQIDYTGPGTNWVMMDKSWDWTVGDIRFLALDSNWIKVHAEDDSETIRMTAIADAAMTSASEWKIVFGHHPYLSNGRHGNAGSYDGNTGNSAASGSVFRNFMEDHILSYADLYLCGHDHSMQVLPSGSWKPLLCVSGGGSGSLTGLGMRNPFYFGRSRFGFAWVGIGGRYLVLEMYDINGVLLYRHVLAK